MQLTKFMDYGLRTLVYLSVLPRDQLASIDSVCSTFDLSRNHVMKIVQRLGQEGYIQTLRGKGGGIRLGMHPGSINLGEVVRTLEPNMHPVNCMEPKPCVLLPGCELKGVLGDAVEAFVNELEKYTLEDLVSPKKVVKLLGVS